METIDKSSIDKLNNLIDRMKSSPAYTQEELELLWEKDRKRQQEIIEKMFDDGVSWGVASGGHEFLNQPEDKFYAHLKKIDNNLEEQVNIVYKDFENYLKTGETPAPYYAWRIAIILSKQKMKDKELAFLDAWCQHFSSVKTPGSRYKKLIDRAVKKGVKIL